MTLKQNFLKNTKICNLKKFPIVISPIKITINNLDEMILLLWNKKIDDNYYNNLRII